MRKVAEIVKQKDHSEKVLVESYTFRGVPMTCLVTWRNTNTAWTLKA